MQLTRATIITALAATVAADNCTPGLAYCGSSLLGKGNYQAQIDQCLFDNQKPLTDNGRQDLFYCAGGRNGLIMWQTFCVNGCRDNGNGNSDTCK